MFEGPLDLLLHLCQKHELDVLDIPISFVTEKYLEYLAVMQLMNLDVASEYLVMAATLAHIKSKMLLPAPPPGQEDELATEEEDPREALIRRLLEYQKYKQAGEELSTRGVAQQNVFVRGMAIEEAVHTGLPPLAQVPLFSLVEAFQSVLSKSQVKLSHDIVHERVTLADRINELVDVLRRRGRVTFEELFEGLTTRFDLVITFLALLEMTRLRMTRLFQADFDSHIYIEFTAQVTADDEAAAGAEAGSALDTEAPPAGSDDAFDLHLSEEGSPFRTMPAPPSNSEAQADADARADLAAFDDAFSTEPPTDAMEAIGEAETTDAEEPAPIETVEVSGEATQTDDAVAEQDEHVLAVAEVGELDEAAAPPSAPPSSTTGDAAPEAEGSGLAPDARNDAGDDNT
ncbi:MAG: Segregation and condensation protein [Labilithrix sp.]|nr:Segregation and condensation protein [Labilithrix sp.]